MIALFRHLFPRRVMTQETLDARFNEEAERAKHWLNLFEDFWSGKRGWR